MRNVPKFMIVLFIFVANNICFSQTVSWKTSMEGWARVRAILPSDSGAIYFATNKGIRYTPDACNTFRTLPLLSGDINALAFTPSGNILAGTNKENLLISYDKGTTWYTYLFWDEDINSIVTGQDGHIYMSSVQNTNIHVYDNDANYMYISNEDKYHRVNNFCVCNNGYVFAATDEAGTYLSMNHGDTWAKFSPVKWKSCQSVAVNSKDEVFVMTEWADVYKSSDYGINWTCIFDTTGNGNSVYIDKNDNIIIGCRAGLFLSKDNGDSWIYKDLKYLNMYSIVSTPDSLVLVGTDNGLYYSNNFYTEPTPILNKPSISNEVQLYQNYPNPYNPSTTISYSLPKRERVKIIVYNMLGQNVAELVNRVLPAGKYSINFDGSNLSSGLYFYQIKAGQFVDVKKMLLIK